MRMSGTRCTTCARRGVIRVDHRFARRVDGGSKLVVRVVQSAKASQTVGAGIAMKLARVSFGSYGRRGSRACTLGATGDAGGAAVRWTRADEADVSRGASWEAEDEVEGEALDIACFS